ncbi:hypothetical protein Pan189_03700 [Stratiformator vulcanicus]|uniref:Uncharacterized protein n=1 Tax=Stratiformator vulcanicus TaxID=2527980 RepID=A0A517QWG5_9PLAN|nr:hypothetical protein Pan189_03700 [Stratiformator vulcanicus]
MAMKKVRYFGLAVVACALLYLAGAAAARQMPTDAVESSPPFTQQELAVDLESIERAACISIRAAAIATPWKRTSCSPARVSSGSVLG